MESLKPEDVLLWLQRALYRKSLDCTALCNNPVIQCNCSYLMNGLNTSLLMQLERNIMTSFNVCWPQIWITKYWHKLSPSTQLYSSATFHPSHRLKLSWSVTDTNSYVTFSKRRRLSQQVRVQTLNKAVLIIMLFCQLHFFFYGLRVKVFSLYTWDLLRQRLLNHSTVLTYKAVDRDLNVSSTLGVSGTRTLLWSQCV